MANTKNPKQSINTYCLKCRKKTDQRKQNDIKLQNGRMQHVYKCWECGVINRRFFKPKNE